MPKFRKRKKPNTTGNKPYVQFVKEAETIVVKGIEGRVANPRRGMERPIYHDARR